MLAGAGPSDRPWTDAIEQIRLAAGNHGISACMVVGDGTAAATWARAGFDRVMIGSDIMHLLARMGAEIAQARTLVADQ